MKAFLDLIPLIAFFLVVKQYGVVQGAGALLVTTIIVYIIHFFRQQKTLDKQQWFVLVLTIIFCGVTVALNDDYFVRMKSPVINGIFALTLIGSVLIHRPLMKMALKQVFVLSESAWKKLTLAWAGFFTLMGCLHYYTAFHTSDEIWVSFKLWGWIPFMLLFMLGQFFILRNRMNPEVLEQAQQKSNHKK